MITRKNDQTYTLRIAGRDYTLTSSDAPEHVRRVAVYMDRKLAETASSGFLNREAAAVIAGLSIADELLTSQDDNTRLRRELMQARQELQEYRDAKPCAGAAGPRGEYGRPPGRFRKRRGRGVSGRGGLRGQGQRGL